MPFYGNSAAGHFARVAACAATPLTFPKELLGCTHGQLIFLAAAIPPPPSGIKIVSLEDQNVRCCPLRLSQ